MSKKKKKKNSISKIIALFIILLILFIIACFLTPSADVTKAKKGYTNLFLPYPIEGEQIVEHTGYVLSYNEEAEQPSYVAYELTREKVYGSVDRKDNFRPDPYITTGSASLADYKSSGYDRGHLAPAADFKWSEKAMDDTFYLSNMSPQRPKLNRNIWADLEAIVRQMAVDNEIIYVATGPVLTDGPYETIGENRVAIPNYYYKVILDYTEPEIKAIGFILPNADKFDSIETYIYSIDEVEEITQIDFFYQLDDDEEEIIESRVNPELWSLKKYTASKNQEKTLIEDDSKNSDLKELITIYFVEFKKEVFKALGITKYARMLGLL